MPYRQEGGGERGPSMGSRRRRRRLVPHRRVPAMHHAVASCCSRPLELRQHRQNKFRTYEGPSPFRAKEGEERLGLTHFYSGPYLTERPILAQPDFEPGHVNPGGLGCVPGRSGPKRTRPNLNTTIQISICY
jgi:hypothetical protein